MRHPAHGLAWVLNSIIITLALLPDGVRVVWGQVASNSTTTAVLPHITNGSNFDFTSAAVSSFVLFLLGLAASLIVLARHLGRVRTG